MEVRTVIYWNPETNVTQYEKPAALPPPLPPGPPPATSTPKLNLTSRQSNAAREHPKPAKSANDAISAATKGSF
ncbi:UNVERIFIED_CONTAM: hypothetical protein Sangu_2997300 [Sesamum angustifolium]|uniref:WW domain-containing protein n=1 Tax=Sesamum angustifolium TaxID=2727405 RepID=A0AAW2KPF4_9LAMI